MTLMYSYSVEFAFGISGKLEWSVKWAGSGWVTARFERLVWLTDPLAFFSSKSSPDLLSFYVYTLPAFAFLYYSSIFILKPLILKHK